MGPTLYCSGRLWLRRGAVLAEAPAKLRRIEAAAQMGEVWYADPGGGAFVRVGLTFGQLVSFDRGSCWIFPYDCNLVPRWGRRSGS